MQFQYRMISRNNPDWGWCYPTFGDNSRLSQSSKEPTRVPTMDVNFPWLDLQFRRKLAASIAWFLETNGVYNLLWGDILHEIHGGQISLPHVS